MIVALPFPPSDLSGHNNGQWWDKNKVVASYRAEAFHLTRAAQRAAGYKVPASGDIAVLFTFYPPDNRGDRVNYPNRMKPQIDGVAEALGVNDKRFLPFFRFCENVKPGSVEARVIPMFMAEQIENLWREMLDSAIKERPENDATTSSPASPETLSRSAAS